MEGLFHDAELAFEDQIVGASRISGKIDALLISVARTLQSLRRWFALSLNRILTWIINIHLVKYFAELSCKSSLVVLTFWLFCYIVFFFVIY